MKTEPALNNVDFLRHALGRHTYFKPVSDRAQVFCAHPAVHGLLCFHEQIAFRSPTPGVRLGHPIELKGWYEYHTSEFEGTFMVTVNPPFTYEDADPFGGYRAK